MPLEIDHDPITELTPLLKRLQLGSMAATPPERVALQLNGAGFEETCRLEDFDWSASITLDRRLLYAVCSLEFLDKHEHVLFVTPDLLILDDLGVHRLTPQQSAALYELIINRHRASSCVITSNRAVDEWLSLFDDPILGNSALDRLANASYQIVIEDTSYRERLSPHCALLGRGGD